jgi:sulfite oxidase
MSLLSNEYYTPNDLFYVRNHLPTPEVDASTFEVEICGLGIEGEGKTLTLDDVKRFPKHSVTATIQCGGNRRYFIQHEKIVARLSILDGGCSIVLY